MNLIKSFLPVISSNPKLIILGSMPGVKSLELNQYYGHKQNHFWKIMSIVYNQKYTDDYSKRLNIIFDNDIVLWDVLMYCQREGSLDCNIKNVQPNDILSLLKKYPSIKSIYFNGQKAEKLFAKHIGFNSGYRYYTLLSSSPANAIYSFEEKLVNWTKLLLV